MAAAEGSLAYLCYRIGNNNLCQILAWTECPHADSTHCIWDDYMLHLCIRKRLVTDCGYRISLIVVCYTIWYYQSAVYQASIIGVIVSLNVTSASPLAIL